MLHRSKYTTYNARSQFDIIQIQYYNINKLSDEVFILSMVFLRS